MDKPSAISLYKKNIIINLFLKNTYKNIKPKKNNKRNRKTRSPKLKIERIKELENLKEEKLRTKKSKKNSKRKSRKNRNKRTRSRKETMANLTNNLSIIPKEIFMPHFLENVKQLIKQAKENKVLNIVSEQQKYSKM